MRGAILYNIHLESYIMHASDLTLSAISSWTGRADNSWHKQQLWMFYMTITEIGIQKTAMMCSSILP